MSALAYLLPQDEDLILIIKYCQGLERDSWEWILKMCWLYEPSPDAAAAVIAGATAVLSAWLLRWFTGGR